MPAPFRYDRAWRFARSRAEVWAAISDVRAFPGHWSWLRELDAPGLHAGAVARCVIQSPLPYQLRLEIEVERAVAAEVVETYVRGDLDGPARLDLTDADDGSTVARLSWELEANNGFLRTAARLGRPVLVWAHDRVVDVGVAQFRRVIEPGDPTRT
ncbi:MAG TPA: hypothetical protein VFZ83_11990 [Acidimicrobiia bacterium]|nr:hypothetical protein [Acidimicrobiia bacterium]